MLALLLIGSLLAAVSGFPDAAIANGAFEPVPRARGVPKGQLFSRNTRVKSRPSLDKSVERVAAESAPSHLFGGGNEYLGDDGQTKTIFVNVPQEQYPNPEPIAAGPPRKHYRIVFIRSPNVPPPQPILPPRVEQKTLIYVLHPRQTSTQNVVEVPDVKHDPQVYFIQYDNEPPTAQELQDLVQKTIGGNGESNINFGSSSVLDGAPGPANVLPPSHQPVYASSSSVETSFAPFQRRNPSQIQQGEIAQTFSQRLSNSDIHKTQTKRQDNIKLFPGIRQINQRPQQNSKLIHTRATTSESKKNRAPISHFSNKALSAHREVFGKESIRRTSEGLRGLPFNFGSKLKSKRNVVLNASNKAAKTST